MTRLAAVCCCCCHLLLTADALQGIRQHIAAAAGRRHSSRQAACCCCCWPQHLGPQHSGGRVGLGNDCLTVAQLALDVERQQVVLQHPLLLSSLWHAGGPQGACETQDVRRKVHPSTHKYCRYTRFASPTTGHVQQH
jgi:hypothetical protein